MLNGRNAGDGSAVRPQLRQILWAYPSFDPASELHSAQSADGTLDDCASWGGARDDPLNSSNPGVPKPYLLNHRAPASLPQVLEETRAELERQQDQEPRQNRELQEKTMQLQQHHHWILSSAHRQHPPPSTPSASGSVVDATALSGCGGRQWKRVCREEGANSRADGEDNAGDAACPDDESLWRRARRTRKGQKVVETGYPFPVASAGTQLETDKASLTSSSQGVSSLSFASTPGGNSRCFLESSAETSDHRVLHRRRVARLKRKEAGSTLTENNPADAAIKRKVILCRKGEEASQGQLGLTEPSQGSVADVSFRGREDETSSGPIKRCRPLPKGDADEACGRRTDEHTAAGENDGINGTEIETRKDSLNQEAQLRPRQSPPPLPDQQKASETKQLPLRFELSGPSTLSNSMSKGSSTGSAPQVKITRKGSFSSLGPGGGLGSSSAVRNAGGIKWSSSFPFLSQAVSSTTSQHTSNSVVGGSGVASMTKGASDVSGTWSRPGEAGVSTFAALYQSRMRLTKHEEESLYALPRFEKKRDGTAKEGLCEDTMECGMGCSSDDEASPKFVLSSGRTTVLARPKKPATIDDEFEDYFAKLLL